MNCADCQYLQGLKGDDGDVGNDADMGDSNDDNMEYVDKSKGKSASEITSGSEGKRKVANVDVEKSDDDDVDGDVHNNDDIDAREKITQKWMQLVEREKRPRSILREELKLKNVDWSTKDSVAKLVEKLVNAELGKAGTGKRKSKRKTTRESMGKYFDEEAELGDDKGSRDENENPEDDDYSINEPGDSGDEDFRNCVVTSDLAEDVVYQCQLTGKGIKGDAGREAIEETKRAKRAPKTSNDFKGIHEAIRKWKLDCTPKAVSARREGLKDALLKIKIAITESENLNLIDKSALKTLKAEIKTGK